MTECKAAFRVTEVSHMRISISDQHWRSNQSNWPGVGSGEYPATALLLSQV